MVKLQFRFVKRRYKRRFYQYQRVSLNFPMKYTEALNELKNKDVKVTVTKEGKTFHVSLTPEDR